VVLEVGAVVWWADEQAAFVSAAASTTASRERRRLRPKGSATYPISAFVRPDATNKSAKGVDRRRRIASAGVRLRSTQPRKPGAVVDCNDGLVT
jgi:hypothetical protein